MDLINKIFDVKKEKTKFLLVGSPNVGKSSLFNRITWKNSPVANYDRLTTNYYSGSLRNNKGIEIVDLPGINSLNPIGDDEKNSFDYIFNKKYNYVVNVTSASTLQRDLFLTIELAEAGLLDYLIVNMIDELDPGVLIKKIILTKYLKVPVSLISTRNKSNIQEIVYTFSVNIFKRTCIEIKYNERIEKVINECLNKINFESNISPRFLITQTILNNQEVINYLKNLNYYNQIKQIIELNKLSKDDIYDINNKKNELITKIINEAYVCSKNKNCFIKEKLNKTSKIDKFLLNPWFALPVFILTIALIYFLTFYEYTGGYLQKLLAEDGLGVLQTKIYDSIVGLSYSSSQMWWASFVSDGIFGGIFTIISFTPWILILFFLTSILEQVGFLSRMSIVFDNLFSKLGLSGRSIVNLITGIGCNIPAILLAKNSNSIKEKVVTIFISPFVSCSARVVVFGFLGTAIFGSSFNWALNIIMTFCSIIIALFVAYCFSNIWFRKANTIFINELVRFRSIDFITIIKKIIGEIYSFIKRTIIIVGVANLIIWILMHMSPSQVYLNDPFDSVNKSFLWYISYPLNYILYPLGIGFDWRFSISLISALPAKEIIASNIDLLFGDINNFTSQICQITHFVNPVIFSFIFFICFYIPCIATLSIMKKEIGLKYTIIHVIFSILFAYIISFTVFTIFSSIQTIMFNYEHVRIFGSLIFVFFVFISLIILVVELKKYLFNYKKYLYTKKQCYCYKLLLVIFTIISIGSLIGMNVLILV